MSDDQSAGAPSFGDLFDDPDAPAAPVPTAPTSAATPVSDRDLVTGHDLEHESAEASHLVAGFEHVDDNGHGEDAEDAGDAGDDTAAADDEPAAPDLATGHDLDHDSAEASHLVAGFEDPDALDEDEDGAQDDPAAAAAAAAAATAGAAGAVSVAAWDGTVDPAVSSAPATRVDTGRLYRSAGAEGPATLDAIPAIDPDRVPERVAAPAAAAAAPVAAPKTGTGTVGLTYSGVMVVVIAATVLTGFLEAVVRNEIGWLTGLALLVSSVYAAVFVRHADIWAAVVAPPLAFLATALTAGQLTLGATGTLLEREGFMIFKTLAVNAPWILATTLICLGIVLLRRRRA